MNLSPVFLDGGLAPMLIFEPWETGKGPRKRLGALTRFGKAIHMRGGHMNPFPATFPDLGDFQFGQAGHLEETW